MDRKVNGYSVIEVLTVVVILSILLVIVADYSLEFMHKNRVDNGINKIIELLEDARMKSVSKIDFMYGIEIDKDSEKIKVIKAKIDNCQKDSVVKEYDMPTGVVSTVDVYIVYDRNGFPRNASCGLGMSRITLKSVFSDNIPKKSICVNRYGRIRVVRGENCGSE